MSCGDAASAAEPGICRVEPGEGADAVGQEREMTGANIQLRTTDVKMQD